MEKKIGEKIRLAFKIIVVRPFKKIIFRARFLKRYSAGQKFLLAGIVLGFLLVFYLAGAMLILSGAELRLAELRASWEEEPICREDCQLWRRGKVAEIVRELERKPDSRLARRFKKYFYDQNLSREFKIELVKITRQAFGPDNPPAYLKDYVQLSGSEIDSRLQAAIIAVFSPLALASEELATFGPLDFYFSLLLSEADLFLRREAVRSLSNHPDKSKDFSANQLEIIKSLVLDLDLDNRLRQDLVFLLGDYYPFFPDKSREIWAAIYDFVFNDEISRALAADFLNRLAILAGEDDQAWPDLEISAAAWEEYYQD